MRFGISPGALLASAIIMSQPSPANNGNEKRSRLGARAIRAFFIGSGIGLLAFFAIYFMGTAINLQAGKTVLNPIALGLVVFGFILLITLGIDYSEYMQD